jgi:hypothetical protein
MNAAKGCLFLLVQWTLSFLFFPDTSMRSRAFAISIGFAFYAWVVSREPRKEAA